MDQQFRNSALDGIEMAEPRVGGVELFGQLGDAVFKAFERELIALAELQSIEPLAERTDRPLQFRRHGATAFHQRRDTGFELDQRVAAAFGGGALEPVGQPADLGGKLGQRAVGGHVGDDSAQRDHGLFELPQGPRVLDWLGGRTDLVDLLASPRTASSNPTRLSAGFSSRSVSRTSAKPAFQPGQGGAVHAGLAAAIEAIGERAHLGFEFLDRAARHGLGQCAADLVEVAAQRREPVLVGLLQRRDLIVDLPELLLQAGHVRSRRPCDRCGCRCRCRRRAFGARLGAERGGSGGRVAVKRALARGNLRRPAGGARARRLRRRLGVRPCAPRAGFGLGLRLVPFADDLIEPAVEPRQRVGDAVGRVGARAAARAGAAFAAKLALGHACELPREVVETLGDGGEVVADADLQGARRGRAVPPERRQFGPGEIDALQATCRASPTPRPTCEAILSRGRQASARRCCSRSTAGRRHRGLHPPRRRQRDDAGRLQGGLSRLARAAGSAFRAPIRISAARACR
jgi:hypothetical protein